MRYTKNVFHKSRAVWIAVYAVLLGAALYRADLSPSFTMMFQAANIGLCGAGELLRELEKGQRRRLGDVVFLVGVLFVFPGVYIYAVGDDLLKWWPPAACVCGSALTVLVLWRIRRKGGCPGIFRELILWVSFTGAFFALFCGVSSPEMAFYGGILLLLCAERAGREAGTNRKSEERQGFAGSRRKEQPGVKQYLTAAAVVLLLTALGFGNAYRIAELTFGLGSGPAFLHENEERIMTAEDTAFLPGAVWLDTEGERIQAHGGQVQQMPVPDGTGGKTEAYVWIGENKNSGHLGNCFSVYTSEDLHRWTCRGDVLRSVESMEQLTTDPYFTAVYGNETGEQLAEVFGCINTSAVMERPKMLYNEKTDQYVLWFHSDDSTEKNDYKYDVGMAGVAVSDSPFGPFRFLGRYRLSHCPEGQLDCFPRSKGEARDMNLFQEEDGTAYIVYTSENNKTLYISRLNEEYTGLSAAPEEAVYGKDYIRLFPGTMREAPVLLKGDNGRYYLMSSSTTGWMSNQARVWSAADIFGNWQNDGNPCQGRGAAVTFDSQSTSIFKGPDGRWIYYGDRWNPGDLADSRYIWLPVEFEDDTLTVSWDGAWN